MPPVEVETQIIEIHGRLTNIEKTQSEHGEILVRLDNYCRGNGQEGIFVRLDRTERL